MRILWLGNAPGTPSGYGEQAALFIPRLRALGHELAIACNWGADMKLEAGGLTFYANDNQWGNHHLGTYAEDHQADLVIALCDAWVLRPQQWPDDLKVAVWAPVDHYPIPPAVLATLCDDKVRPIAMSRFGEKQMQEAGLEPLYVPHAVDSTLFRPRPDVREPLREELGIPQDAFVVGMVGANKGNPSLPRKGFPQAFHAFARFVGLHDDAWLYVHSETDPPNGGISLTKLARAVGCPKDRVGFPPDRLWHLGMTNQVVAALYQVFDVLLMPSMGEGFGIPLIEAQACGVPVITSNHSAMTELGHAGWLVSGDPWWDALQDSFLLTPAIDGLLAALEAAYQRRGDEQLSRMAVEFAAAYDADSVTERFWQPALERLTGRREVPPFANSVKTAAGRPISRPQEPFSAPESNGHGPVPAGLNRAQRRAQARAGRHS